MPIRVLKFEFHIILYIIKYFLFLPLFPQPFKKVTHTQKVLNLLALKKQVVDQILLDDHSLPAAGQEAISSFQVPSKSCTLSPVRGHNSPFSGIVSST